MKINLQKLLKSFVSLFVALFLLSIFHIAWAGDTAPITENLSFQKGRIWKADGYKVHFSTVTIGKDTITYKPDHPGGEESIGVDQVIKVEIEKGSYALEYGVGLGVAGLLGSAIGVSTSNTEGIEPSSSAKNGIILSMTAVSGLIGAAIGSGQKKYETVYSSPESQQKSSIRILPEIDGPTKTVGIRISYRFY